MQMPPPAARCCATAARSRRHRRTSCPARVKSPAAAKAPLPPPSTAIRMLVLLRIRRRRAGCGQQLLEAKMLHLTHGVARQAVDPNILARNLVACELRQTKGFDLGQIAARTRTPHHKGDGHLLPLCIGATDDRG